MSSKTLRLLSPLTVGAGTEHALTLANRVIMGPMTRGRATEDGVPTSIMVEYYVQRASAGLIITEGVGISKQGLGWWHAPGIFTDDQMEAWTDIVDAVHKADGRVFLQLWHMGRQSHSDVTGQPIVSASPIALQQEVTAKNHEKKPAEVPHELSVEEIAQVVKDYGNAARLSKEAGFDGVEIHAANGYLIDQFTQSVSNTRTDAYGGSVDNRLRFMREVVEEVLTVFPKERVSIRLSPNGMFGEMGSEDNIETFTAAIQYVAGKNLGIVHLMDGLGFGFHKKTEPFTTAMAREIIRKEQSASVLVCNVGYTKETGEAELEAAEAEENPVPMAVCMGRPFIANPDLIDRIENDWPLAEAPYPSYWGTDTAEGYSDWGVFTEEAPKSEVKQQA